MESDCAQQVFYISEKLSTVFLSHASIRHLGVGMLFCNYNVTVWYSNSQRVHVMNIVLFPPSMKVFEVGFRECHEHFCRWDRMNKLCNAFGSLCKQVFYGHANFRVALDSVVWYGVYTFPKGATTAMEIFSIGQVARLSGVGVETVRFYEREGS